MQFSGWLTTTACALALVAAPLAAQDAATQRSAGADRTGEQKVTLTGCVERADQVLSRANLGTTVDSLSYVLVKAQAGPAQSQPASPAGAGEQGLGKAYRLDVDRDTMNPHVGHRVEIVGWTAQAPADAPVGTSGRSASPGDIGAAPPIFKVETVKMLSSTCGR